MRRRIFLYLVREHDGVNFSVAAPHTTGRLFHPPPQETTAVKPWRNAGDVLRSLGEGGLESTSCYGGMSHQSFATKGGERRVPRA